jgi:transposase-like protein
MIRARPWTEAELAYIRAHYPDQGAPPVAVALDRSRHAIHVQANRLGLQTAHRPPAPMAKLMGEDLEQAIVLREEHGWSFERIGRKFGVSETAVCNAVLIALCPRKGHRPAERDARGFLLPHEIERLRLFLRKGVKGQEIQLRMGISAARVAEERRRYTADLKARDKAPLPAPGNGEAYCGARVAPALKRQVEQLYLDGFGSATIKKRTGVSLTTSKRIRDRLIKRLARKGECLPGCDIDGVRRRAKHDFRRLRPEMVEHLKQLLLQRMPVAQAAEIVGIGKTSGYRIRDDLRARLEAAGQSLPDPIFDTTKAGKAAARAKRWMPHKLAHRNRYKQLLEEHDPATARQILEKEKMAERMAAAAAPAPRQTFEQQLQSMRPDSRLITIKPIRKADPAFTLGGVATGALL